MRKRNSAPQPSLTENLLESRQEAKHWLEDLPNYLIVVALTVCVFVAGFWASNHFTAVGSGPKIVTFDVIKLVNAQRKIAGGVMINDTDSFVLLNRVGKTTEQIIRSIAGEGTVVIIKAAMINSDIPDITDEVLISLGLPTDAPGLDLGVLLDKENQKSLDEANKYFNKGVDSYSRFLDPSGNIINPPSQNDKMIP